MTDSERHIIPVSAIGQSIGQLTTRISTRQTMAYAAGIGSTRAAYFTDVPIAPPALVTGLEWPLLNGDTYRALLGASQSAMERAVHLSQRTRFYRPVGAETIATVAGQLVGMRQTRRGVLVKVALDAIADDDERVAASSFVALFLRAELDSAAFLDRPQDIPELDGADHSIACDVPAGAAHVYTACSGIWNPIHTEPLAARSAGFDTPIMHGTWTWAGAMEQAIDWWCDGDPTLLEHWDGDFLAPVLPGRPLVFEGASSLREIRLSARQDGRLCMRAAGRVKRR